MFKSSDYSRRNFELLNTLSDFEKEILVRCAVAQYIFYTPLKAGQTSVTSRGSEMLSIYALQKEELLHQGDVYSLTDAGYSLHRLIKTFAEYNIPIIGIKEEI